MSSPRSNSPNPQTTTRLGELLESYLGVVTLAVEDVELAHAFYREVFAWLAHEKSPDLVYCDTGRLKIALCERNSLARYFGLTPEEMHHRRAVLSWQVNSPLLVGSITTRAIHAGARVLRSPHQPPWGGLLATFTDPDHHLWEIIHNPRHQCV